MEEPAPLSAAAAAPSPPSLSPSLSPVDPVSVSVSAYAGRVGAYAEANGNRAGGLVERFLSGLCPADDVILDAGCGPGRDLVRFAERGHCAVGVDLSAEMLSFAAEACEGWPVRLQEADLRRLPFEAGSFSAVWACASLVHLPSVDARLALSELARVARRDAVVFVSVKAGAGARFVESPFGVRFFQFWDPDEFAGAVSAAGLDVSSVSLDGECVNVWASGR